jgi:hypothetical protein
MSPIGAPALLLSRQGRGMLPGFNSIMGGARGAAGSAAEGDLPLPDPGQAMPGGMPAGPGQPGMFPGGFPQPMPWWQARQLRSFGPGYIKSGGFSGFRPAIPPMAPPPGMPSPGQLPGMLATPPGLPPPPTALPAPMPMPQPPPPPPMLGPGLPPGPVGFDMPAMPPSFSPGFYPTMPSPGMMPGYPAQGFSPDTGPVAYDDVPVFDPEVMPPDPFGGGYPGEFPGYGPMDPYGMDPYGMPMDMAGLEGVHGGGLPPWVMLAGLGLAAVMLLRKR